MKKKQQRKLVSVIIPVYNEQQTIEEILTRVRSCPIEDVELIVIDDCSTDKTSQLLKKLEPKLNQLILKKHNQGKGAALRAGFALASGEIILIQDADLEYNPQDYPKLLAPILEGKADVVYGSRFVGSQAHRVVYFWHYAANRLLTLLANIVTNLNLTDMETGYKAFRRELLSSITLQENGFGFEPEVTVKLAKKRARFYEVGITYDGRTYQEGKKIGIKDGGRAVYAILKYGLLG